MRLRYSLTVFLALLMLVSGAGLLSGCGKKGPLYHPSEAQLPKKKEQPKKPPVKPTQQP